MLSLKFSIASLDELAAFARGLTQSFPSGITFGLVGTLGAGKTTLVQAIAGAAGVETADVTSPTFTLLNSYDARIADGKITLNHLDVYRINDEDEFLELGVQELFEDSTAWTLIEWADRVTSLMPNQTVWINIDFQSHQKSANSEIDENTSPRVILLTTECEPLSAAFDQMSVLVDASANG